jgi:hypothetical protein
MKNRFTLVSFAALVAGSVLMSGCSSTGKRAAMVGAGGAGGAALGATLMPKNKVAGAAVGGVAGAGLTALALGEDKEVYQRGVDDGYVSGSADAVKRLYWAKQALEAPSTSLTDNGRMSYYTWEESGTTLDGRKIAPEKVAVPVFEPLPKGQR